MQSVRHLVEVWRNDRASLRFVLIKGADDVIRVAEILQEDFVELTLIFHLEGALLRQTDKSPLLLKQKRKRLCSGYSLLAILTKSENSLWASRWRCCTRLTAIEKTRWLSAIGWEETPANVTSDRKRTTARDVKLLHLTLTWYTVCVCVCFLLGRASCQERESIIHLSLGYHICVNVPRYRSIQFTSLADPEWVIARFWWIPAGPPQYVVWASNFSPRIRF